MGKNERLAFMFKEGERVRMTRSIPLNENLRDSIWALVSEEDASGLHGAICAPATLCITHIPSQLSFSNPLNSLAVIMKKKMWVIYLDDREMKSTKI